MKTKPPRGYILWAGPSLIDGAPIVAIAITRSRNAKTGNMIQTYIIRSDLDPRDASRTGADFSICGHCPHRGIPTAKPGAKQAEGRACYVQLGQGPRMVYQSLTAGQYPAVTGHAAIAALGADRMVRLGTYGDPAAVPSYIWESLISLAAGHTAYSHQSGMLSADVRPDLYMLSADSLPAARKAWRVGHRTFRIIPTVSARDPRNEALCPASAEAGQRATCATCRLCGGSSIRAKSIAIVAHGAAANRIKERLTA